MHFRDFFVLAYLKIGRGQGGKNESGGGHGGRQHQLVQEPPRRRRKTQLHADAALIPSLL